MKKFVVMTTWVVLVSVTAITNLVSEPLKEPDSLTTQKQQPGNRKSKAPSKQNQKFNSGDDDKSGNSVGGDSDKSGNTGGDDDKAPNSQQEVPDELVLQCQDLFVVNENKTVLSGISGAKCTTTEAICYLLLTEKGQMLSCVKK